MSLIALLACPAVLADENLFGYVKGAETLPEYSWEGYTIVTNRKGKSDGHYEAWQLTGPSGRMWVSLPGGGLTTFPGGSS